MGHSLSDKLFSAARDVIPGGVNSPVRAFKAVGGNPPFIARAKGARVFDEDGNQYIDYVGSWGPMLLGHARPEVVAAVQKAAAGGLSFGAPTAAEVTLARKIVEMVPSVEMVRLVNSGTEATMSAVRLARGYTGRPKVLKFEGGYHGHADFLLAKAGSGVATLGVPDSAGVPPDITADTITVPYNEIPAFKQAAEAAADELACVIVEPVAGNMGCVPPEPGFLEALRETTARLGALLIFDEVMTGFRVAPGGVQELTGITPDLTTLGKVLGGGLPLGAYGGRRDIMEQVAPSGPVYQAGTLSGNPLATAAGLAQLQLLTPGVYAALEARSRALADGLRDIVRALGTRAAVQRAGSMLTLFFTDGPVRNYADAARSDRAMFASFHSAMLESGIYLPPSQFEAWFVSAAHEDADIEATLQAARRALEGLR